MMAIIFHLLCRCYHCYHVCKHLIELFRAWHSTFDLNQFLWVWCLKIQEIIITLTI